MISKLEDTAVITFNPTTLEDVRAEHGLDAPGRMDEAVDMLQEWLKKQEHFVRKDFPREYLERFICHAKGSTETVKRRLDNLCTLRTTLPHLFEKYEEGKDYALNTSMTFLLPKLTDDHQRVFLAKYPDIEFSTENLTKTFQYYMFINEYMGKFDYFSSISVVYDARGMNIMSYATKVNLLDFRNSASIYVDAMGYRLKGLHVLSTSKVIDVLTSLLKQILSEKIASRIRVHKTLESLYEHVPRHVLPKEYGGDEKPLATLNEDFIAEIFSKEHVDYFNEMRLARTDESRRAPAAFNQHCLGMPGSFRTLTVD